jgi:hypothetical protein
MGYPSNITSQDDCLSWVCGHKNASALGFSSTLYSGASTTGNAGQATAAGSSTTGLPYPSRGLSVGAIAGIAVGVTLLAIAGLIALAVALVVICLRRRQDARTGVRQNVASGQPGGVKLDLATVSELGPGRSQHQHVDHVAELPLHFHAAPAGMTAVSELDSRRIQPSLELPAGPRSPRAQPILPPVEGEDS